MLSIGFQVFLSNDDVEKECVLLNFILKFVLKIHLMGTCGNSDVATIRQHESHFVIALKTGFPCDWLQGTNERAENKTIPWNSLPVLPLDKRYSSTTHPSELSDEQWYLSCLYYWLVCSIRILTQKGLISRKKDVFAVFVPSIWQRDAEREEQWSQMSSLHNTTKLWVKKSCLL